MENGQFFAALGIFWVFGFAAVLLIAWNLRSKRRLEKLNIIHAERMKAMEKGIPLPEFPEIDDDEIRVHVPSGFGARPWNPRWPLGVGALLITGGVGTSLAMALSAWRWHNDLWPFGLIGVFLGVGMFLFYFLTRTPSRG